MRLTELRVDTDFITVRKKVVSLETPKVSSYILYLQYPPLILLT